MINLPVDECTVLTKYIPKIRGLRKINKLKLSRHDSVTQTKCELLPSASSIANYVVYTLDGAVEGGGLTLESTAIVEALVVINASRVQF
jgi:hypothetical protein